MDGVQSAVMHQIAMLTSSDGCCDEVIWDAKAFTQALGRRSQLMAQGSAQQMDESQQLCMLSIGSAAELSALGCRSVSDEAQM